MAQLGEMRHKEKATQPMWKYIGWVASSLLIILALQANIAVIQTDDNNSWVLDILRKINNSYMRFEFYDLLALATIPLVYRYLDKKGSKRDWWAAVLAAAFAVVYVASLSMRGLKSLCFFNANLYQFFFSGLCTLGYALAFYLILRMTFTLAESRGLRLGAGRISSRTLWLIGFFAIIICWLPGTLLNYPGTLSVDATWQIRQFMGDTVWTTHHPPFSTFIMEILFKIGSFVGDNSFGVFLYLLVQTILGAAVFSYSIMKLYDLGLSGLFCGACICFFTIVPLWGDYARWYDKDLIYAELATLNTICFVDVLKNRECGLKRAAILTVTGLLMSLARNNGIYAVTPAMILLCCYLKKAQRRNMLLSMGAMLGVYMLVTSVLYPSLGVQKGSIREMLSVPFQQTARYVVEHGDEVSPEEKEAIDGVLSYEAMDTYSPINADPIKWTYKEDASKLPAYFKAWSRMFFKHPASYINAFIAVNYGFLSPSVSSMDPSFIYYGGLWVGDESMSQYLSGSFEWIDALVEILKGYEISGSLDPRLALLWEYTALLNTNLPLLRYLAMPGLYTWVMLACIVLLLKHKKYWPLLLFVPGVMNVLVCFASPLYCSLRYALPLVASTPLLLGWTFYSIHRGDAGEVGQWRN